MTAEERRAFWQDHFTRWKQSGLGQRAYCAQQGLNLSTFGYWRKRLATQRMGGKLIPIVPLSSRTMIAVSGAGIRLEVPPELLGEVLPILMRSLRELA